MVDVQFLNLQVTPAPWENYVWYTEELMKELGNRNFYSK
jgi:hypothetical protein